MTLFDLRMIIEKSIPIEIFITSVVIALLLTGICWLSDKMGGNQ